MVTMTRLLLLAALSLSGCTVHVVHDVAPATLAEVKRLNPEPCPPCEVCPDAPEEEE